MSDVDDARDAARWRYIVKHWRGYGWLGWEYFDEIASAIEAIDAAMGKDADAD